MRHTAILALDIEGFTAPGRTHTHRRAILQRLEPLLVDAARFFIPYGDPLKILAWQSTGDGWFLVFNHFPYHVAFQYAETLATALETHHQAEPDPDMRIRMRQVLVLGDVETTRTQWLSDAFTDATRFLDHAPFKRYLTASSSASVLAVSALFYSEWLHEQKNTDGPPIEPPLFTPFQCEDKHGLLHEGFVRGAGWSETDPGETEDAPAASQERPSSFSDRIAQALINKGVLLDQLDRPEEAILVYDNISKQFKTRTETPIAELVAQALINKGVALGRLDRPEEAVQVFDDISKRFKMRKETVFAKQMAQALLNKGVLLGQLDRTEEALATLQTLLTRFQDRTEPVLQDVVSLGKELENMLYTPEGGSRLIKQLRLTHWKSFKKTTLYLDPFTVLIGNNASGKSNALDALLLLSHIAKGTHLTEAVTEIRGGLPGVTLTGQNTFTLEVWVGNRNNATEYIYAITAQTDDNTCSLLKESLECRTPNPDGHDPETRTVTLFQTSGDDKKKADIILVQLHGEKSEAPHPYRRSQTVLSQLHQKTTLPREVYRGIEQVTAALSGILTLNPSPAKMRGYSSSTTEPLNPDASNIAGVIAALQGDAKTRLAKAVNDYAKHLPEGDIQKIWAEQVGKRNDFYLCCAEQWQAANPADNPPGDPVEARSMSDGTLRFLAILTALATCPKGSLLIIEEVDNGLHPSRADLLVRMLREMGYDRSVDVLITTHNATLLDKLGPALLPFVTIAHRNPTSGHSQLTLLEDVAQLPKLLASGSVGKLAASGRLEQKLSGKKRVNHGQQ